MTEKVIRVFEMVPIKVSILNSVVTDKLQLEATFIQSELNSKILTRHREDIQQWLRKLLQQRPWFLYRCILVILTLLNRQD